MLTRLKVKGFKNLDDIDVRFGPFTCILGDNGVGKSNVFDAIAFLSALANRTLMEAAATVRGTEGRLGDVRSLFRSAGASRAEQMEFLVEMIVPREGEDDLGSPAKASMTFLRYKLTLRHREGTSAFGPLEVMHESMEHINKSTAKDDLPFPHALAWRDSVVDGRRTVPYIETRTEEDGRAVVYVRADSEGGHGGGGPRKLLAANLPRTVLSTSNSAAEHRTLVLARREMLGWTQFQLEPSALRAPDPYNAPRRMAPNGAHLPAALHALTREAVRRGEDEPEAVCQKVANRLAELFENVRSLRVDEDEKREILSIVLTDLQNTEHLASSLSDGTLRFLALAILEASEQGPSLVCLEEPENGIHPDRIPAMIRLLKEIAVDVHREVGRSNPMRQVIVNTHSPAVVNCVDESSLVIATSGEALSSGDAHRTLILFGLPNTWRAAGAGPPASLLPLLPYLPRTAEPHDRTPRKKEARTVLEREDVRQILLFDVGGEG